MSDERLIRFNRICSFDEECPESVKWALEQMDVVRSHPGSSYHDPSLDDAINLHAFIMGQLYHREYERKKAVSDPAGIPAPVSPVSGLGNYRGPWASSTPPPTPSVGDYYVISETLEMGGKVRMKGEAFIWDGTRWEFIKQEGDAVVTGHESRMKRLLGWWRQCKS